MTERRIDEQLNEYFGRKSMPAESIARIRATAVAPTEVRRSNRWPMALAAAVLIGFVAMVLFVQHSRTGLAPQQVAQVPDGHAMMVAHKLVDRHEHCAMAEFTGTSLEDVFTRMSDLGFEPVMPEGSELKGARFVSAHYCDVNGMRALHAFFEDGQGAQLSLFEFPLASGVEPEPDMTKRVGGYLVTLTARDGLMVAFTRAAV